MVTQGCWVYLEEHSIGASTLRVHCYHASELDEAVPCVVIEAVNEFMIATGLDIGITQMQGLVIVEDLV